jgi:hypothetical protein
VPLIQTATTTTLPNVPTGATTQSVSGGRQGEILASEVHGQLFAAARSNNQYLAATAAAGVTIPISSTTAPTFTLFNPVGSGVVAELIQLNIGITNATTVVSPLLLGYISALAVAPTSTTTRAVTSSLIGGAVANASLFFTAGTLAAAATTFVTIGSVSATSGAFPNFNVDLRGGLVLLPGSLVHVCGTAAQTSAAAISLWFNEWPL